MMFLCSNVSAFLDRIAGICPTWRIEFRGGKGYDTCSNDLQGLDRHKGRVLATRKSAPKPSHVGHLVFPEKLVGLKTQCVSQGQELSRQVNAEVRNWLLNSSSSSADTPR
jgi:hypothetical protein